MKRRSFFSALLAGAAAFIVAPAVKAEAVKAQPYTPMDDSNIVYVSEQSVQDALDRQFGPLTFEATPIFGPGGLHEQSQAQALIEARERARAAFPNGPETEADVQRIRDILSEAGG